MPLWMVLHDVMYSYVCRWTTQRGCEEADRAGGSCGEDGGAERGADEQARSAIGVARAGLFRVGLFRVVADVRERAREILAVLRLYTAGYGMEARQGEGNR